MDVRLMLIDPQRDFCNPPPNGSLFVAGAVEDSERTAKMINRLGRKLKKIYTTLDSHKQYQIFFQMFWRKMNGMPVDIFSQITNSDVVSGDIVPVDPAMLDWAKTYTAALEAGKRYPLIIWPYHCIIGTEGWCIEKNILDAIMQWERDTYRSFIPITKGSCYKTEHYSAVRAEVEVVEDPSTQINIGGLIKPVEEADMILLGGQARNFCLANTVRDQMNSFADKSTIKKMWIVEDLTSDVPGFGTMGDDFMQEFINAGGNVTTSDKVLS